MDLRMVVGSLYSVLARRVRFRMSMRNGCALPAQNPTGMRLLEGGLNAKGER